MGPVYLGYLRERAHHKSRYHHRLRRVGVDTSQCRCSHMAWTEANEGISVTIEECVYLDDMAGTCRFIRDGT